MLLWDIIRDWFVQYIFGGYDSNGQSFSALVCWSDKDGELIDNYTNDTIFLELKDMWGDGIKVSMGDWLSTTATLIVIIAVCVALFFLVRYFFRMFAGLFSTR